MRATLRWNANTDPDLAGYTIAWGLSPSALVNEIVIPVESLSQLIPEYHITGLPDRVPVYFALSAYDVEGSSSALCSPVTKTNKTFSAVL